MKELNDYIRQNNIQIKIFDKKITIFNPGELYGNITVEDLQRDDYQASARNKLVVESFFLTGEVEKYGTGFQRIRKAIEDYPTMKYTCRETQGGFLVELEYEKQKETFDNVTNNVTNVTKNVAEKRYLEILDLISKSNKISLNELSNRLSITKMTLHRDFEILKSKGLIERKGGTRGYWKVIDKKQKETFENVTNNVTNSVTEKRYLEIFDLISENNKISLKDLSNRLSVTKMTLHRDFEILKSKGLIERIGGTRGYWKVIKTSKEI